jgi:hypothetical protein
MDTPHILILGTSAMDTKGRAASPIRPATANPGGIRVRVSGVVRNTAENLARLGLPALLRSCSGER